MVGEPLTKRATAFIDGQNLYQSVKRAFGYHWPNYDVMRLAKGVCTLEGWLPGEVRFYTGIPPATVDPEWHGWWSRKLAVMGRQGVIVLTRRLHYHDQEERLPDGTVQKVCVPVEKGIDVRLALDAVRLARKRQFDVALIFSQDQDLAEVADEVRDIAQEQGRWIKVASAFPDSPIARNHRGIDRTDWVRIDRAMYEACLDYRDYRRPTR